VRRRISLAAALLVLIAGIGLWRLSRSRVAALPASGRTSPAARAAPGTAPPAALPAAIPTPQPATTALPSAPPPSTADRVRREDADRLLAEGKVLEAVEAYREVVALEPTAKNHGDLGSLLYRLTAFDEAAVHLRAAAELDPGNADRWIALANVYYRKVNPGEAWKAEKRARAAEPGLELGRDAEGMRVRKGEAAARRP
jgi:tetratricopeptide (TPR) repeat protein